MLYLKCHFKKSFIPVTCKSSRIKLVSFERRNLQFCRFGDFARPLLCHNRGLNFLRKMPLSSICFFIHLECLSLKRKKRFMIWNLIKTTRKHVLYVNFAQNLKFQSSYQIEAPCRNGSEI